MIRFSVIYPYGVSLVEVKGAWERRGERERNVGVAGAEDRGDWQAGLARRDVTSRTPLQAADNWMRARACACERKRVARRSRTAR